MKRAQGGTRSLPDGFLHIQNFTVTKASGMAGCVYVHILDDHQRHVVESILIEHACAREERAARNGNEFLCLHHFKHGHWRFDKRFLNDAFKSAIHTATKAMHTPVIEVFESKLFAEREGL